LIGWLLDTNVISELNKRTCARRVEAWFLAQSEEFLHLSILTFGEFDKGIDLLDPADARRAQLIGLRDVLEASFADRTLPVSRAVVSRWGRITAQVKRDTGHPPSVVDTLIAATAIEHDLYLVTRNVRDVRRSGAAIFNPWTDDPIGFPIAA
jgi:toxin FitB